ncbi:MAG: reverse transcriptase domain-containing protein [Sulfuriferula sp.]
MAIEDEHITTAYRKLKRLVYYDKTDLSLRQRLANFECDPNFNKKLLAVKKIVNSDDPLHEKLFKKWLNEISFRVVPKSLEKDDSSENGKADCEGKFISNVTSAKVFHVARVNYFFDGPIELHLIAVLWIMFEGRVLDAQLGKECYGSRLEDGLGNPDDRSAGLFRKYHELYARWRDSGIRKAKQLLTEERTSVCILGLDVQEYYYYIQLDFNAIALLIYEAALEEGNQLELVAVPSNMLRCIEAICVAYGKKITPLLQLTHEHVPLNAGIPIGLCCSPLLANWYLRDFDNAVKTQVRPAYYGRYVDDILLVVPAPEDPSKAVSPVETFMGRILVHAGILHEPNRGRYEIVKPEGLFLQQGKCILQYFDVKHSIAGLEKFQKKLEENGSDFLLMPVDEADSSLEDVAYELLYEGSVNKFRSVKGMAENRYELAKHLARQTILHLLTDDPPDPKISLGLRQFFKGKNAIEFHDLWERVFTFFLIANDPKAEKAFTKHLQSEIKRVRFKDKPSVTECLVNNLENHLTLCLAMSGALGETEASLFENDQSTLKEVFRRANLIRHHFVRMPLLNYTSYLGPLTTRSVEKMFEADYDKLRLSPRYVNFDECLLLANSGDVTLNNKTAFQWANDIYKRINRSEVEGIEWDSVSVRKEESNDGL